MKMQLISDLIDCGKAKIENYWSVEQKNYIWLWEVPSYCFDHCFYLICETYPKNFY